MLNKEDEAGYGQVGIISGRDLSISEPALEATEAVGLAGSFAELLGDHVRQWRHLWNRCDIQIKSNDRALACG
jgi:alpha,alpha-trehalase